MRENQATFQGVSVDRVYVRQYPQGTTAAHLLGYVKEVERRASSRSPLPDLEPGDEIGQDGVELSYDSVLRGVNGATRVPVDVVGSADRAADQRAASPTQGTTSCCRSTPTSRRPARRSFRAACRARSSRWTSNNGEILAMGSSPTFDPALLTGRDLARPTRMAVFGDPDDELEHRRALPSTARSRPAIRRARRSSRSPRWRRSTPTSSASRRSSTTTALYEVGDGTSQERRRRDLRAASHLRDALKVSSDVYFYTLGGRLAGEHRRRRRRVHPGLGEVARLRRRDRDSTCPARRRASSRPPSGATTSSRTAITDRPWSVGDNINLSVGQGDLLAAPLQLAVAYAALGNGGTVVTPHVALRAEDPDGQGGPGDRAGSSRARSTSTRPGESRSWTASPPRRWSPRAPRTRSSASVPDRHRRQDRYGGDDARDDQAWYVALTPADDPEVVVVYTIERGGFGVDTAAPPRREPC